MKVKKSIKILLAQQEKTVVDLSEHLGVSRTRAYGIINAENLEIKTLKKCADFFGIKLSELIKLSEQ